MHLLFNMLIESILWQSTIYKHLYYMNYFYNAIDKMHIYVYFHLSKPPLL